MYPFRVASFILTVGILASGVTVFAESSPKTFAVFSVSYRSQGNEAVGGVAGTAFFLRGNQARTAYHVLQPQSFRPAPGFDKVRVWLLHEKSAPIEIHLSDLGFHPERDQTEITLRRSVDQRFVFSLSRQKGVGDQVRTEGFLVNSTGPVLARVGSDLVVSSVPSLQRISSGGQLVRRVNISLESTDVNLKGTPCLQFTYAPVRGLSGGPVLRGGKVIGMNSFADPVGLSTWAVDLSE